MADSKETADSISEKATEVGNLRKEDTPDMAAPTAATNVGLIQSLPHHPLTWPHQSLVKAFAIDGDLLPVPNASTADVDESSIPELASKVIELVYIGASKRHVSAAVRTCAYLGASQRLLKKYGEAAPAKEKTTPASPIRGGA